MFKYIGIRGHRGAGKNTISYLLGVAIDFYLRKNSWVGFEDVYKNAVERVLEDEQFISQADFENIQFESFADTAKTVLSLIIGIPNDYFYNDWTKDSVIVDLVDFSFKRAKDKLQLKSFIEAYKPYTANTLHTIVSNEPNIFSHTKHIYITLRELIIYFSKYVMQNTFGKNVWVKSLNANKWENERFYTFFGKTIYKIFTDCKFPTEISYITNNKGVIVKINRLNNTKDETDFSGELANDSRFDFEINLDSDNLMNPNTIETIKQITCKIINE